MDASTSAASRSDRISCSFRVEGDREAAISRENASARRFALQSIGDVAVAHEPRQMAGHTSLTEAIIVTLHDGECIDNDAGWSPRRRI